MNISEFIARVVQLNLIENDKIQLFWETGRGLEETEHIIGKQFLDWINTNSKAKENPTKKLLFDKREVENLGPEYKVEKIPMLDGSTVYHVYEGVELDKTIPIQVLSFNKECHYIDSQMILHVYDIKKI